MTFFFPTYILRSVYRRIRCRSGVTFRWWFYTLLSLTILFMFFLDTLVYRVLRLGQIFYPFRRGPFYINLLSISYSPIDLPSQLTSFLSSSSSIDLRSFCTHFWILCVFCLTSSTSPDFLSLVSLLISLYYEQSFRLWSVEHYYGGFKSSNLN